MGNPATPAPMEDLAVEYIIHAAEDVGTWAATDPEADRITRLFYKGIYRGIFHFLMDHMFVPLYGADPEQYVIKNQITPLGDNAFGPGQRIIIPFIFINEAAAWKNEVI